MTTSAFLSGRLPSGDANGLAAIVRALIDDPSRVHVIVALVDCVKVTQLVESGATVPTVRMRRLEAISDPADMASLRRLLMREFERRTGQPVLPLELERDVEAAFGDPPPADPPPPPEDDPPARKGRK